MKDNIIKVIDIVQDRKPISPESGQLLYQAISKSRNIYDSTIVDFTDIEYFTTAFINNSISAFVEKEGFDSLRKFLKLTGIQDDNLKAVINLSIKNATSKYKATLSEM